MQVEVNVRGIDLEQVVEVARRLEAAGVDVVADGEIRRDPAVSLTMVAGATSRIRIATAVTIAFARSPMVNAYTARNLHELSRGRFSLGLGTQVKRHVQRRFSADWDRPGPRLRDHVRAIRDIWRAWDEGGSLEHRSDHYTIDLMTPEFDLGPNPHGAIDLAVAAVNPYNLATAARYADTVRLHAFGTPAHLHEVVLPELDANSDGVRPTVVGGGFVATGADEAAVVEAREASRARIAFYGTTRTYRPVLDHHGWGDLAVDLRSLADAGRWEELAAVVPDDVVDTFVTAATYDRIAPAIAERFAGLVDRVQLPCPPIEADWEGFATAVDAIRSVPGGSRSTPSDPDEAT